MGGEPPIDDWERLAAYVEAARIVQAEDSADELVHRLVRLTSRQRELVEQALRDMLD